MTVCEAASLKQMAGVRSACVLSCQAPHRQCVTVRIRFSCCGCCLILFAQLSPPQKRVVYEALSPHPPSVPCRLTSQKYAKPTMPFLRSIRFALATGRNTQTLSSGTVLLRLLYKCSSVEWLLCPTALICGVSMLCSSRTAASVLGQ